MWTLNANLYSVVKYQCDTKHLVSGQFLISKFSLWYFPIQSSALLLEYIAFVHIPYKEAFSRTKRPNIWVSFNIISLSNISIYWHSYQLLTYDKSITELIKRKLIKPRMYPGHVCMKMSSKHDYWVHCTWYVIEKLFLVLSLCLQFQL